MSVCSISLDKGVEQDVAKAVEFYEKAAKQGFAPAQVASQYIAS